MVTCDFKLSPNCSVSGYRFKTDIVRTRERNGGKYICLACSRALKSKDKRLYKFDDEVLNSINTEFKAYFLGVIAGDGYIRSDNMISVELHKDDREILDNIALNICPEMRIKFRRNRNTCYITLFSREIVDDLVSLLGLNGPGKKSHSVVMPDLPEQFTWHFVRGLFDTDGTIRNVCNSGGLQASISTRSKKMLSDLSVLTETMLSRSSIYSITWCGSKALDVLDKMYKGATIYLNRKHQRYIDWVNYYVQRPANILTTDFIKYHYLDLDMTMKQIAIQVRCHEETVRKYVKISGLKKLRGE